MPFYTYILKNTVTEKYYTGSTQDLEKRLERHNNGYVKSTKSGAPNWKIVHFETFLSRSEAQSREVQIKKKKSRIKLNFIASEIKNNKLCLKKQQQS